MDVHSNGPPEPRPTTRKPKYTGWDHLRGRTWGKHRPIGSVKNVVRGDCHIGTLLYQHNLNLDVHRSSSVETDLQLSLDESDCIACVRVQSRDRMKSTMSISTTNGSRGGQNTVKLMTIASSYKYYEHLQLTSEVFVVRKRGRRCNPI